MSKQSVNWGRVLTGAAIAAGAIAALVVFPEQVATLGGALKDTMTAVAGDAGSWVAEKVGSAVGWIGANAALAIGTAGVAGGVMAHKTGQARERLNENIEQSNRSMEHESFAMREDIRRMQGLMAARMQAMGVAPSASQGIG